MSQLTRYLLIRFDRPRGDGGTCLMRADSWAENVANNLPHTVLAALEIDETTAAAVKESLKLERLKPQEPTMNSDQKQRPYNDMREAGDLMGARPQYGDPRIGTTISK